MTKYIVQGGSPLFGEVHISGAKNAAVAILPAALLVDGVCRIENIPQISDVTVLLKILEQLGAKVRVLNRSDVELDCRHIVTTRAPQELAHKLLLHTADQSTLRDELLHTVACKSAIKAGMHTDPAELQALVDKVQSGAVRYCPHGRPVAGEMTRYQIEKMFKRA